jgi:peptidoglycan biosynthesis protein MviN/MurJ (putative lipid II flippase)
VFAIVGTILNGAGLTRQAITVAGVTLGVAVVANYVAIPRFEPGRDVLLAAAVATGGAMVLGAALGGWYCVRHLGAFLPVMTLVRVLVGIAAAIGVGRVLPWSTPLMTLAEACVVGLTFLATLVVTRELTGADLRAVASVVRRRKGSR